MKGTIPVLAEWLSLPLPIVAAEASYIPKDDKATSSHASEETYPYHGSESFTADATLHLASLSSLSVLFHTCTPRIGGWSTTIIDAIGRCWVGCLDLESERRDDTFEKDSLHILKKQLKEAAVQLGKTYPGIIKVCPFVVALIFLTFMFKSE